MRPADVLFPNLSKQIKDHICPCCQEPATDFRNEASRNEQKISGMCQAYQDEIFGVD